MCIVAWKSGACSPSPQADGERREKPMVSTLDSSNFKCSHCGLVIIQDERPAPILNKRLWRTEDGDYDCGGYLEKREKVGGYRHAPK